jgi:enoyl-CoA hydratase/carnithine racemase
VDDPGAQSARLGEAVAWSPRAAVAMGRLLRATEVLDVATGLAAEAAVYSMLLGGPEFARWLAARGPARPPVVQDSPLVRLDRRDDTLVVTLDRRRRRNALDAGLREELVEALGFALADASLTRVTLTADGPDFSAGGDLDEFGTATDLTAAYLVRLDRHPGHRLFLLGERLRVHVHGSCIGAGMEMPAFASLVVADPGTTFALPELAMGLVPGAGGTVSVPHRIGRWRTTWLAATGDRIDAATALSWGLVDRLGPRDGPRAAS